MGNEEGRGKDYNSHYLPFCKKYKTNLIIFIKIIKKNIFSHYTNLICRIINFINFLNWTYFHQLLVENIINCQLCKINVYLYFFLLLLNLYGIIKS